MTTKPKRPETLEALRDQLGQPFPPEAISTIAEKGGANYISHGIIRKRLNEVVPGWTIKYEPNPLDRSEPDPSPLLVEANGKPVALWIRVVAPAWAKDLGLHDAVAIGGVNWLGNYADTIKGMESDALTRAVAMEWGVGLELWTGDIPQGVSGKSYDKGEAPPRRPKTSEHGDVGKQANCGECKTVVVVQRVMASKYPDRNGRWDKGDPIHKCPNCDAWTWYVLVDTSKAPTKKEPNPDAHADARAPGDPGMDEPPPHGDDDLPF